MRAIRRLRAIRPTLPGHPLRRTRPGHPLRRVHLLLAALTTAILLTPGCLWFAPAVKVSLSPASGSRDVPLLPHLRLQFSAPMDPASVRAALHPFPATGGEWQAEPGDRIFDLTPAGLLPEDTRFALRLEGARTRDHSQSVSGDWWFETGAGLHLAAVTLDGRPLGDLTNLLAASNLGLAFSAPVNPGSLALFLDGAPVPATGPARTKGVATPLALKWASDTESVTIPLEIADPGHHVLELRSATDITGRPLTTPWSLSFSLSVVPDVNLTPLPYPLLVQIEDSLDARPQTGLQEADMVFDYQVEGGVTRLTALYQQLPPVIGPIRSARFISIPLQQMYGGLLACSGVSQATLKRLRQSGIPTLFDSGYYYRSSSRGAPHNLYAEAGALAEAESAFSLPARTLALTSAGAVPASEYPDPNPSVAFLDVSYAYDAYSGEYLMAQSGIRAVDFASGVALHIADIVVMHTTMTVTDEIEDSAGAHAIDYDMSSGGAAEVYRDGQRIPGRWSRPVFGAPLVFTSPGGGRIPLKPGLVWVDVIP
jgi:hypothetical protein